MTITVVTSFSFVNVGTTTVNSTTFTSAINDIICATLFGEDATNQTTSGVFNSGTGFTWNAVTSQSAASNTLIKSYWALATSTQSMTVTGTCTAVGFDLALWIGIHKGCVTTNAVPSGTIFTGNTNSSLAISSNVSPTSTGSALWLFASDWAAVTSYAALANNTTSASNFDPAHYNLVVDQPITQPRTDQAAFILGISQSTTAKTSFIGFEVVASSAGGGGGVTSLPPFTYNDLNGMGSGGPFFGGQLS